MVNTLHYTSQDSDVVPLGELKASVKFNGPWPESGHGLKNNQTMMVVVVVVVQLGRARI